MTHDGTNDRTNDPSRDDEMADENGDAMASDELLDRLVARERELTPASEAPLADLWSGIESRMSLGARTAPQRRWIQLVGMAATLVLGFALGRIPLGTPGTTNVVATVDATSQTTLVSHTYDHTTADLLGETAVLLAALPAGSDDSSSDRRITTEAAKLLVTTRLLLDSQASSDPRLRTLLEDLELVLAQMARMRAGGERTDRELITEAMQDRELVPRIRTYAAQLAASAD